MVERWIRKDSGILVQAITSEEEKCDVNTDDYLTNTRYNSVLNHYPAIVQTITLNGSC